MADTNTSSGVLTYLRTHSFAATANQIAEALGIDHWLVRKELLALEATGFAVVFNSHVHFGVPHVNATYKLAEIHRPAMYADVSALAVSDTQSGGMLTYLRTHNYAVGAYELARVLNLDLEQVYLIAIALRDRGLITIIGDRGTAGLRAPMEPTYALVAVNPATIPAEPAKEPA